MKNLRLIAFGLALTLHTGLALGQGSVEQLKSYMTEREQIKNLDLAALKAITDNPKEKNVRRGLAGYYVFLKAPVSDGDVTAGTYAAKALEKSAEAYMDPCTYVKLAAMYSRDYPGYGVKRDETKLLRYLSIAWEMGDLSDKATGDNALLTLIVNNTLGIGDGIFVGNTGDKAALKKTLDAIRPDVLKARARFKKLYGLSVKDETPGSTNVERHYAFDIANVPKGSPSPSPTVSPSPIPSPASTARPSASPQTTARPTATPKSSVTPTATPQPSNGRR